MAVLIGPALALAAALAVSAQGRSYGYDENEMVLFPLGERSFVDAVHEYRLSDERGRSDDRSDPAAVLGPPDAHLGAEPESLALGNATPAEGSCAFYVIARFDDNYLVDIEGDDLWVFEAGSEAGGTSEPTEVYISTDGGSWISVGGVSGDQSGIDIAPFVASGQRFRFVRVCDEVDERGTTWGGAPGPDIDAIGAIGAEIRVPGTEETPQVDEPTEEPQTEGVVPPELLPGNVCLPPPGGGRGGPVPNPCLDPAVDRCIDGWMREVEKLADRKQPDRAPHRFSRWGQWEMENGRVYAPFPPDDFETLYFGRRSCFVWAQAQNAHRTPLFVGELQSLAGYVDECVKNAGGTSGDPTQGECIRTVQASKRYVLPGESVVAPVWLFYPGGTANMNFSVGYDDSIVRVEGTPTRGSLVGGSSLFSANSADSGLVRLGFARSSGLLQSGTLANLTFRAVGRPGDRTPLTVGVQQCQDAAGSDLGVRPVDGEIIIIGEDDLPPGGVLGGRGNCDGDGDIDVDDAQCVLDMSTGRIPERAVMDVDRDGSVTSGDARQIVQYVLGILVWTR